MHTLLIIVMAFVVPLAGITAFILIDKGFDALGRFFSRRRNRTLASNTAKSNSSASADDAGDKKIDLVQIDRPAAASLHPAQANRLEVIYRVTLDFNPANITRPSIKVQNV